MSRAPASLSSPAAGTAPPPPEVPVERELMTPAVVHLGLHGLRDAHHTVYVDEIARQRLSLDWGLIRMEVQPSGGQLPEDAPGQHRVQVSGSSREVTVLVDYITSGEDSEALLEALAAPSTKVVTVETDVHDPLLATGPAPEAAAVVHTYLARALARRRSAGRAPFTVVACDAPPRNGPRVRAAVLEVARRDDPELAAWIEEHGRFPSSVLDPVLAGTAGCPRWIVEDSFSDGRPPLEVVGAQFVTGTVPHETLRMRLYDATRCLAALLSAGSPARTTDEALTAPAVRAALEGFLDEAAAPVLQVPGVDLAQYRTDVVARLADPRTGELLEPLQAAAAAAFPTLVLPSLRQAVDQNHPRQRLVLALAAWMRSSAGAGRDAEALLRRHRDVLGTLADEPHLVTELQEALDLLEAAEDAPHPTAPLEELP
ncbi:mannitol dehydrogenase family protein [Kineococcus sp. SYSU DK003]|uniref:mannitol dehydrogenase family protein n=1 Tax=Kineococcus sp. SYSU DK003 TaxID=3383124 RepID=UPI003D7DAF3F